MAEAIPIRGGPAALTVPGAVDGWWQAHQYSTRNMGSALPWKALFGDAIAYARDGFSASAGQRVAPPAEPDLFGPTAIAPLKEHLWPLYHPDALAQGPLVQRDLALTLEAVRDGGPDAFYGGDIGRRIVAALSHSRFWRDTVVLVLEDDAQSGPDHVDSHRSVLLTISAYNRAGAVHRFINTTDVIATIEDILGLRSLSQFDHFGRPMSGLFAKTADLRPYDLLIPDVNLKEMNPPRGPAAEQSAKLDLSRVDAADDDQFNRILWSIMKGDDVPYPGETRAPVQAQDFGR